MNIVFLFYHSMTALDAIGPHEVLCRLPNANIYRTAKHAGIVETESSHLKMIAEYSFNEVTSADILLIPGAGNATSLKGDQETLAWIQDIHRTTTWTTSICTGSLILGAAGILSGLKATSHWAVIDRLSRWGATPTHQRIVEDNKVITAAGVSAGIDMALALAEKICGRSVGETLQLGIEYDPEPPFNSGSPQKASPQIYESLKKRLLEKFEE